MRNALSFFRHPATCNECVLNARHKWECDELNGPDAKTDKFVALLRPLQRPLEAYCRRMLRNPSLVEDVIQDAVSASFARFDRYTEGTNFKAWIFRFVTLEIFNRNRKHEPIALVDLTTGALAEKSWDFVPSEDNYAAMLNEPDLLL